MRDKERFFDVVFTAIPVIAPPEAKQGHSFWVNVFLWADSEENAITLAKAHVLGLGWLAGDDAQAKDATDAPLQEYADESLPHFLQAQLSRNPCAVFVAQPGGPPTAGPQVLPLLDIPPSSSH